MREKKSHNIIAIVIFLALALVLWIGLTLLPQPRREYVLGHGEVVEFLDADFGGEVVYFVFSSRWMSFPDVHFMPADFADGVVEAVPVPAHTLDYSRVQFATHKMTLRLPVGQTYGLFISGVDYAMRLFIDGRQAGMVGVPGTCRETTTPRVLDSNFIFTPEYDYTTLILHTANFVHRFGANPPPITIGHYQTIQSYINIGNTIAMLIMGYMLAAAFFHLGIFALNRKRITSLVFSACCFLFSLMPARVLMQFLTYYNWQIFFRVEYLVHYGVFAALVLFLEKMHQGLLNKTITRSYYIFAGVYALMTIVFDSTVFTRTLIGFWVVSIFIMGYVVIKLTLSLRQRRIQNALSFVGIMPIVFLAVNDMVFRRYGFELLGNIGGQDFTVPFGMLFLVFCYTLALSFEYAESEWAVKSVSAENDALERLSRMKTQYLADMSHEIKTPLAVILGDVQRVARLIKKDNTTDERIAKSLTRAEEEVMRISRLTKSAISMAALQETREKMSHLDAAQLFVAAAEGYRSIIEKQGNILRVYAQPNLPKVFGNADQLIGVLLNLLTNANKHTKKSDIAVNIELRDNTIEVMVADGGEGIGIKLLETVFERGMSGSGSTGMGLAICKDIVRAHGGEIGIESTLGMGTVVTFLIPAADEREADSDEKHTID